MMTLSLPQSDAQLDPDAALPIWPLSTEAMMVANAAIRIEAEHLIS